MHEEAKVSPLSAGKYSVVTAIFAGVSLLAATVVSFFGVNGLIAQVLLVVTTVSGAAFLGATYVAMAQIETNVPAQSTSDSSFQMAVWHSVLYHLGTLGLLIALAVLGFQANMWVGVISSVVSVLIALVIVRIALQANEATS